MNYMFVLNKILKQFRVVIFFVFMLLYNFKLTFLKICYWVVYNVVNTVIPVQQIESMSQLLLTLQWAENSTHKHFYKDDRNTLKLIFIQLLISWYIYLCKREVVDIYSPQIFRWQEGTDEPGLITRYYTTVTHLR